MRKLTYEYVNNFFEENGCKLVTTEYLNDKQLLQFICACGNASDITFNNFRGRKRCKLCGYKSTGQKKRFTFDYVKKYFSDHECVLLSNSYVHAHGKLSYICSCGNVSEISFANFKSGQRCRNCQNMKLSLDRIGKKRPGFSGNNHPKWNPDRTDEDRIMRREYPEYKEWASLVKQRDDYTCVVCNKRGEELHSHHLDGYNWCVEKRLDVNNGVTLCSNCHYEFHSTYGYGHNTVGQFVEFSVSKGGQLNEL